MVKRIIIITVITVIILPIVALLALGIFAYMSDTGMLLDYSGWQEKQIPTESELIATVKLPLEWSFVTENGRIIIKDNEGKVIATELFEGWYYNYDKGGVHYSNIDELDINSELPKPYTDVLDYELVKGSSSPCYLYKISAYDCEAYALNMNIMDRYDEEGAYCLFLVFDKSVSDMETYDKLQKSFRWGGFIEE